MIRIGLVIGFVCACMSIQISAQTTHLIRGVDFAYLPDTAYLTAGDSIHFDPTGGLHNMTQTELPAWLINQAISNGGFDTAIGVDTTFVIDTAGTYYFVCLPHGYVGMKGVLIVAPLSTSIEEARINELRSYPDPTTGLLNIGPQYVRLEVFDLMGNPHGVFTGRQIDISGLKDGFYLLRIKTGERTFVERIQKISN